MLSYICVCRFTKPTLRFPSLPKHQLPESSWPQNPWGNCAGNVKSHKAARKMTAPGPHHLWNLHGGLTQQFPASLNWVQCSRWGLPSAEQSREHLLHPAGHALCSAPQGTIGPLGHWGWLVVNHWPTVGQPSVNQDIIGVLGHWGTLLAHDHPVCQPLVKENSTGHLGYQGRLLTHGHPVGQPGPQGPFLQSSFPAAQPLALTGMCSCSSSGVGLYIGTGRMKHPMLRLT